MSRSGIAVIIPTFNRIDILPRAIDSVLAQTLPADEIIIIDDGSDDDTIGMLAETYPADRFRTLRCIRQENLGVSAARNHGIRISHSPWLAFLDSDDAWLPDKLARQKQALKAHPDHLIAHCDEIWIRRGRRVNAMNKHRKYGGMIFRKALPLCVISPSAVMMARRLFNEVGLFDETLPACEDYDLWLRICSRYPVLFLEEALITKYGGHEDQLSQKYPGMDRFRIRALQKMLDSGTLNNDDHRAAVAMLHEKAAIYAQGARKRGKLQQAEDYEALAAHYR